DQILGDLGKGNGDPSLAMFGQDVTPNQHALARRFVTFYNFYADADVSADGSSGISWRRGGPIPQLRLLRGQPRRPPVVDPRSPRAHGHAVPGMGSQRARPGPYRSM